MNRELYKCCICLNTVKQPLVMCHQTHIGCFDCVCKQLENSAEGTTETCALCRQTLHLRFDRLIQETSECFHKSKRRKKAISKYEVFLQLLELNDRPRYRSFTKAVRRFSKSITDEQKLEQLHHDIGVIMEARDASQRLAEYRLLDNVVRL